MNRDAGLTPDERAELERRYAAETADDARTRRLALAESLVRRLLPNLRPLVVCAEPVQTEHGLEDCGVCEDCAASALYDEALAFLARTPVASVDGEAPDSAPGTPESTAGTETPARAQIESERPVSERP